MKISDEELESLQELFNAADRVYLEADKLSWQTSKQIPPKQISEALKELQHRRELMGDGPGETECR